jgi:hypothetical protein
MKKKDLGKYLDYAVEGGATSVKPIQPSSVVTAAWVRLKCQFGCPGYDQSYCCPPHTPTPEETRKILDSYNRALLFHIETLSSKGRAKRKKFLQMLIDLEGDMFKDGYYTHTIGCVGGKRYLGFESKLAPNFEFFLSYGIPGKLEGERYKKSPELVKEHMKHQRPSKAPGDYIVFKRFDKMENGDKPLVVIFFASPDVLSGIFTLANFDATQPNGVIAPFCAGCGSIVDFPLKELQSPEPRAVLGMFDVSARPCVPSTVLTFAVPWSKYVHMVDNMGESFLITKSWNKVRARMKRDKECS